MTWVDLYSFGSTTVQFRKVEPSQKSSKDKKHKAKDEPILIECEIIPPKPTPFTLCLYTDTGKIKEYNLPRKIITVA